MIKVKAPPHLPGLEQQMKGALGARDNKRRAGKVQVRQGFLAGGFSTEKFSLPLSW